MGLASFIEEYKETTLSLAVVNQNLPGQLQTLLADMFDEQSVRIEGSDVVPDTEDSSTDMIYLLDGTEVVAASPLSEVADSILLVNSDLHTTGARGVSDVDPPEVITALDETYFRLRGYPESNKEKLLLITISRYIERLALERGTGTHRASFQQLSRLRDEHGTRVVYERLADSDVDVHVYGTPDRTPLPEYDLTMHGGWSPDFRDAWFVIHIPDGQSDTHAALLAMQDGPNMWEGFWTYDTDTVRELNRYIEQTM